MKLKKLTLIWSINVSVDKNTVQNAAAGVLTGIQPT